MKVIMRIPLKLSDSLITNLDRLRLNTRAW
jgi:hypothetical protein